MSTTEPRGSFITFEGVDGSGKTTQMHLFADWLRGLDQTVIETAEPGGTLIGSSIRATLLNPDHHMMGPTAEMLLYFAARAQNVDEILEPALSRGNIVISDRWTDSTIAYQGFGRKLGTSMIEDLDAIACRGRKPDLTFWIDLDLDAGLERARLRNSGTANKETRMDEQRREFYELVTQGYRYLAEREPNRVIRVDGSGDIQQVAERVQSVWFQFRRRHV